MTALFNRFPPLRIAVVTVLLLHLYSCTSLRLPAEMPSFPSDEILRISREGVTLEARPVITREEYWELFDDYLPELGIAAVWVNVRNTRGEEIIPGARWNLRIDGRRYRAMDSDALLPRYYKRRRIRMYSINTDRKARGRLETLRFHPGRIAAAADREGLLFFPIDPARASDWHTEATLASAEIVTSKKQRLVLELPLSYAHPQR
jgi:hypothetical protein